MKKRMLHTAATIAGCFLMTSVSYADVVYDNSSNDLSTRFNPGILEVGDQIELAGTDRFVTNFTFGYWASNISVTLDARVRFYANDGSISNPSGLNSPGTLLFDSGWFNIGQYGDTTRSTLSFNLSNTPILVPDIFTWSIQFDNVAIGGAAGVDIFSPPTVGTNYVGYWEYDGANWVAKTNEFVNMDFAAQVVATVPEPSAFALFALGAAGLYARFRRKS